MKRQILAIMLIAFITNSFAQNNSFIQNRDIISKYIAEKYPNSRIIEFEWENDKNMYEVELIHDSKEKDIYFDSKARWQSTKYDINKKDLPQNIINIVTSSQYNMYRIDDIEVIETPENKIYKIELEKFLSDYELTLFIDENGNII